MAFTPPSRVALLHLASSCEFVGREHRHYVAYPVAAGPQACLIEFPQKDGSVQLIDSLVILPKTVPKADHPTYPGLVDPGGNGPIEQGVADPIYAGYLGVIAANYALTIAKAAEKPVTRRMARRNWDQSPFMPASQKALASSVAALLKKLGYEDKQTFPEGAKREMKRLRGDLANAGFWNPQHMEIGKTRARWDEQWRILALWDSWELRRLPWWERLKEHLAEKGKKIGRMSQEKDAFEKVCRYMGLRKDGMVREIRIAAPFPERKITV